MHNPIVPIFSTPLGIYNLDREFSKKEMKYIRKEESGKIPNTDNFISVSRRVLDNDKLSDLKLYVESCIDDYVKSVLDLNEEASLYITQSWLNFTDKGQSHFAHQHANSFISGVIYIKSGNNDGILFTRNDNLFGNLKFWPNKFNSYNSNTAFFPAKEKMLILFPSCLTHSVPRKESYGERISLSFNTFIKGNLGKEEESTFLSL